MIFLGCKGGMSVHVVLINKFLLNIEINVLTMMDDLYKLQYNKRLSHIANDITSQQKIIPSKSNGHRESLENRLIAERL